MEWILVYEKNCKAVEMVSAAMTDYLPYLLRCVKSDELTKEEAAKTSTVYIGRSSQYPAPENGYRIVSYKAESDAERIVISADDDINLMYAAVDFGNKFLVNVRNADIHQPTYYFKKPFEDPMPEYDEAFVPSVKNRALWTWGYCIYDYKGYIDNMLKLKLNMLVIWNDYPPVNAKALVDYAHENGVKVIWGFSWGWGLDCAKADISDLDSLSNEIIKTYNRDYAPLSGDGIYFQSFTETSEERIGDVLIAEAVTRLVNKTAGKLLETYPNLHIQFGIHATSVKKRLEYIKNVNPSVYIVWEDCGAFPFDYIPKKTEGFDETALLIDDLIGLREGNFGCVLKGLTCLDWSTFKHQPGRFAIGGHSERFIENRTCEKTDIWRYVQAYWIRNAHYALELIRHFDENTIVEALVEDGMFERGIWYPVALYAEMLWDSTRSAADILGTVALMPNVRFA